MSPYSGLGFQRGSSRRAGRSPFGWVSLRWTAKRHHGLTEKSQAVSASSASSVSLSEILVLPPYVRSYTLYVRGGLCQKWQKYRRLEEGGRYGKGRSERNSG